jgi:chalcone isomerase-like protein
MRIRIALLLAATLAWTQASAVEIEGVQVPEAAQVGGQALVLNGAGLRKKLWVEVYVGALYVPSRSTDPDALVVMPGAKRFTMYMLYDVSRKKLVNAWNDGFEDNSSEAEIESLADEITAFNALWRDSEEGDVFMLDYIPGEGTHVVFNGDRVGTIEGEAFNQALMRIWLGPEPPTEDLKEGLLGG